MTPAGWAFMVISCGSVICLVGFCYYKVLTTRNEHPRKQAESKETE